MSGETSTMAYSKELEYEETPKDDLKLPTYSKSLADLVSSLTHSEDDEEDNRRHKVILLSLGLSGDTKEQVDLAGFRHVISNNLNVDTSFMFKKVFNAFDETNKGYLTGKELVSAISILLNGPFQQHINLGMRVYGKPEPINPDEDPEADKRPTGVPIPTSSFTISRVDAILSIVESLQLSSPRARHTLTTDNREKAYHIGEDLVFIIYPKLDIDGDGIVSLQDFTYACHADPTLVQVFGQFLPKDVNVRPPPMTPPLPIEEDCTDEATLLNRPKSSTSLTSFEGIDYLKHSPSMGQMWGRTGQADTNSRNVDPNKKSNRLEPIPVVNKH